MATRSVEESRIQVLNDREVVDGTYVLYWMQASQRATCNPALEHAALEANALDRPLLVCFGLMDDYPEANLRHYTFLLEGLRDLERRLKGRRVKLVVRRGDPDAVALDLGGRASLIVCDRGYLRHQKRWRAAVAHRASCRVVQVEGDVVVPVQVASDKREWAARTIRGKIHRHLDDYLTDLDPVKLGSSSLPLHERGEDLSDPAGLCARLRLDRSVQPVSSMFRGGGSEAERRFRAFCTQRLDRYAENRNHPETTDVSHMAKYLHFGMVSPVWLLRELARHAGSRSDDRRAYVEELLVRRELAINFVEFTGDYDSYGCLPDWAQRTLDAHRGDRRDPRYSARLLEQAETHDEYWNAAMREMKHTGYMHNYMRMYWGKKVLEWSSSPEHAHRTALALNNKYFLDGRDPNSFANVAWVFGNHDRPWQERAIYGTVRSMSAAGLERKCDISAYVDKVDRLVKEAGA